MNGTTRGAGCYEYGKLIVQDLELTKNLCFPASAPVLGFLADTTPGLGGAGTKHCANRL